MEVVEAAQAVNKGGTALITPFADESRQRAFYIYVNEECLTFLVRLFAEL